MSLNHEIRRFLDDVDPKILARGQAYYDSGQVERIEKDGGHVTAEVSGSDAEPYQVEIDFSENGEIDDWTCDCPYDWGDVCKHTVAVLLAFQDEIPKETNDKKRKNKVTLQKLVGQAEKNQLVSLILEHCREDKRFQSQVLSELEDTGEQELASIKALIKGSIRSNKHYGYIDMDGCDNICADLDDALDKARNRVKRGQYSQALEITRFVLLTGIKLIDEETADDSSGSLSWTIDATLETIGSAANCLAETGGPREYWVRELLGITEDSMFDGWDPWRYELLQRISVLADTENEKEFYGLLDRLSDRQWEKFEDTPRYEEEDKVVRYYVMCSAHGAEKARAYLEQNVKMDKLRLLLVRENMEKGDYAGAERLCQERAEAEQSKPWLRISHWQYLLYEIYQNWEQREKQIGQACKLALLGDREFYQTAKELLMEDGQWEAEYPGFLTELKAALPAYAYMELLKLENETALLIEQVRLHSETVFQYGDILAPEYGGEVCGLCVNMIRENAKNINNRKDYRRLCDLLRSLLKFGGNTEVKTLIRELKQAYPRRPALWEELERVEQRL